MARQARGSSRKAPPKTSKPSAAAKHAQLAERPKDISFHYIKSNLFRVIKVDGAHGGVSLRGEIHVALFNERRPIPVLVKHSITEAGKLGTEIERVARDGVVREVEADMVLLPATARSIARWLVEKAEEADRIAGRVVEAPK